MLMKLFYKVVYADSKENFDMHVIDIQAQKQKFKKFVERFEKYMLRKDEWAMYERAELCHRKNHTNNYAEASMKIMKEAVLHRNKAFNPCALIEYIIGPMEEYYKQRLLDHAYNRNNAHSLLFNKLLKRMTKIKAEDIVKLDDNLFKVPSAQNSDHFYEVHTENGFCTCPAGENGAFCKHQAKVVEVYGIQMPSAPPLFCDDRYELGQIALGTNCLAKDFFLGSTEPKNHQVNNENEQQQNISESLHVTNNLEACESICMEPMEEEEEPLSKEGLAMVSKECFGALIDMAIKEASPVLLQKLNASLQKPSSPAAATAALVAMYRAVGSVGRRGTQIPVQPTGRARRRNGVSKRAKQVSSGRPSKVEKRLPIKKKQRNLSQAVKNNTENA